MKINPQFVLRDVCGESVIMQEGSRNVDLCRLMTLNETATFLWKEALDKDFTAETLVEALLAEYDVAPAQAEADVKELLARWQELGMLLD